MLCYKIDNWFPINQESSIDFFRIKAPDINEDLFSQFALLIDQTIPILDTLSQIYQIIISDSISFTLDFPLPDLLSIAFEIAASDNERLSIQASNILISVLINSNSESLEKIGRFYYQHEFHELLLKCFYFNEEDFHPDLIFHPIASYSSTCIEARDAILALFPINKFDQYIQVRNITYLKEILSIFIQFLKYPLEKEILDQLYSKLQCFASIEDDSIIYHTLIFLSNSYTQTDNWPKLLIKNNLLEFVKDSINQPNEDINDTAIDILYHLSESISIDLNVLQSIADHFLICESIPNEFFTFRSIAIFNHDIKRTSDPERIERYLEMGLLLIFLKVLDEGCYESKKCVISALIQLMRYCNDNQVTIFIEENLFGEILDVISDEDYEDLSTILDMLNYTIKVAERMGCLDSLFETFNANEDFQCFLHSLLESEKQELVNQAQCLLRIFE